MRKPLIGITCGRHYDKGSPYYGSLPSYIKAVEIAGGLPVLIAPNVSDDVLRAIYERMDGVLVSGGGDVDPSFYGMESAGLVHETDKSRDIMEINVSRWAASENKPLLGICRGCQVVNVALGGTLYRDIPAEYFGGNGASDSHKNGGIDHDLLGKFPRSHIAHTVKVEPESRLASVVGEQIPQVNSLHHQALRDVAADLTVSAISPDGLIEGVEMPNARFFVGVQWHPEELVEYSEPMRRLFEAFIVAARSQ
jgi:putative glutamine amidotransferase